MFGKKMAKRHEELAGVPEAVLGERRADIVDQHRADLVGASCATEQIRRKRRCRNFRNMLVLGDSLDLGGAQPAHCDTVFN